MLQIIYFQINAVLTKLSLKNSIAVPQKYEAAQLFSTLIIIKTFLDQQISIDF